MPSPGLAFGCSDDGSQHEFLLDPSGAEPRFIQRDVCSYKKERETAGIRWGSSGPPVKRWCREWDHRPVFEITAVYGGGGHWEDKRAAEVVIHQRRGKEENNLWRGRGFGSRAAS